MGKGVPDVEAHSKPMEAETEQLSRFACQRPVSEVRIPVSAQALPGTHSPGRATGHHS